MCAVFVRSVEYSAHRIVDVTRIVAEIRSIQYLRLNRKAAIRQDLTGLRVDIPETGWCEQYSKANLEYKEHQIVDISELGSEIRRFEHFWLYMQNGNCADSDRAQSWHIANWLMWPVFLRQKQSTSSLSTISYAKLLMRPCEDPSLAGNSVSLVDRRIQGHFANSHVASLQQVVESFSNSFKRHLRHVFSNELHTVKT